MPPRPEPPRQPGVLPVLFDSPADLRAAVLVLAVAALLLLPPLGQRVISTSHEARFAVLAQDMLRRQAWLEARVGGEVYRNKPPLFPWSIAALSLRGPVTEATAQAPAALAALSTVLLTFLLGRVLWGRRGGLWAGLILVTSYDFHSRQAAVGGRPHDESGEALVDAGSDRHFAEPRSTDGGGGNPLPRDSAPPRILGLLSPGVNGSQAHVVAVPDLP